MESTHVKVTLSLDEMTWLKYRSGCILRKIKPSRRITQVMQEQVTLWENQENQEEATTLNQTN